MRVVLTISPGGYFVTAPQLVGLSDADMECLANCDHPRKDQIEFVLTQAAITLNNATVCGTC